MKRFLPFRRFFGTTKTNASTTPRRMDAKELAEYRDESHAETLHGVQVKDPFRVLEDPDHAVTKRFVDAQNKLTFEFLDKIPYRERLKKKLTELYNFERFGCPFTRGGSIYYFYNSGLQPQSVLYKQKADGPEVFLDPNAFSEDGTVSLNALEFSKSGSHCAYGVSNSGSDWVTIKLKKPETAAANEDLDLIEWAKFTGISWTHDEKGFFYSRYPKPENVTRDNAGTETAQSQNMMPDLTLEGTTQAKDLLIMEDKSNPEYLFGSEVSDDGDYAIVSVSRNCDPQNQLYIAKINEMGLDGGTSFFFRTTLNAPKRRIVKYDLAHPEKGFEEIIGEKEDVIELCNLADKNKLILVYLQHVKHVIFVHDIVTGKALDSYDLPLPLGSIIQSMSSKKEDSEIYYKYASFTSPGTIIRFDFNEKKHEIFKTTKLADFDTSDLEVEQVFYASDDGTKIPMYIISNKGAKNTQKPTLLYGYGGFNISIRPTFSLSWMTFVKLLGGVVAVANIRGGGEYGQDWHDGGRLKNKQNTFTDFQCAAQYLIDHNYTTSRQLAINGGSNGGLLVAACANQRPDLFAAVVGDVGVMDLLRFHRFTIGSAWVSDYGDPEKVEDFNYLLKISPLHNVRTDVKYPAILLTTSDHDDRVVPLHSLKLIAALQWEAKSDFPILIRVDTKSGHGAGKSTQQVIEETVDKLAFMSEILGCDFK
ncbi:hypothetical protein HDU67_008556 [Dinochytrium kinnereticum]|nr:hypothetical protein HDU67_008556 [Dinochytrium kinnereticum]